MRDNAQKVGTGSRAAPNVVLRTDRLTKRFGDLVAVDGLTLEVYESEIFGFLGPNGAGKTTAIHMMCGLLKPDRGQTFIHGRPVTGCDIDIRARVGVCPQNIVLWNKLTCLGGRRRRLGDRSRTGTGFVGPARRRRHRSGRARGFG